MIEKRQLASHKKRNTTDLICFVLFATFTLVMLIAGLFCYSKGSIAKFNVPHDSGNKGCGTDYPDHKFIYFPSPQYDSLWITTCVKQCPKEGEKTVDCKTNSLVQSCSENNNPDNTKAFHIYPTYVYRGSVCLPNDQIVRTRVLSGIGALTIEQIFGSVIKDWSLFLLIVPIVLGMALLAVLLIRLTAGYVVYVLYAIAIGAFIGIGVYLLVPSQNQTFFLKKSKAVAIAVSVLSFGLGATILAVFCAYRQRIKKAVQYIDKANIFFKSNYTIIILPFVLVGFLILFLFFWIFLTLSFYSMSTPIEEKQQLPFQHYKLSGSIMTVLVFNLFYLVWGIFFLMHTGNFIVSGSVVNWQFRRENPYLTSSKNYLLAHIGSVSMGSFLTSLLGAIKFQLDEADCAQRQYQKQPNNKCIDCLTRCYGCFCCFCIYFVFRCFHHAAYAYQNLTALSYCQSAGETYQLIGCQRQKWSIIAFLYLIFDQFIPLTFTVLNVLIANAFIQSIQVFKDNTSNRLLVFAIVAILAYAISQFFIGIYSQTIQTLFVIDQFHRKLLARKEDYQLQLEQSKPEVISSAEKPHSQRISLFQKH